MTKEITISASAVPAEQSAPASRYVSIFEDPSRLAAQLQVADLLSRSQFVPQAFQGKPEDCLVALDMAARLELNPLAVFPDIYVIDGRASFSSKFLIAMVNRSGKFSRIQFETGVDGEAEVTFSGWGANRGERKKWKQRVPNHYAVATMIENGTEPPRVFTSPRVDMNFAEKNGWVEKSGSKWQTMPEIMTRYRAASILIKSVCPEIVMGLEFAEDLQDAREETTRPVVVERRSAQIPAPLVVPASTPSTLRVDCVGFDKNTLGATIETTTRSCESTVKQYLRRFLDAESLDDLNSIAREVHTLGLDAEATSRLRAAFKARRDTLAPPAAVIPEKTGLPGEPTFNCVAARAAIENAADHDALTAIKNEIEKALNDGRLKRADASGLLDAVVQRRSALYEAEAVDVVPADEEPESGEPTAQQLEYAENLRAALVESAKEKDRARLEKNAALATDWAEQGYLTKGQAAELYAHYEELARELEG